MRSIWVIALLCYLTTACVPHKKVLYFKDLAEQQGSLSLPDAPEVILKTGDVVEVNIASVSQETNIYFQKQGSATDRNFAPNTYQIASDGTIDLPLIGKVPLEGKNISEAESSLKELLTEYLQKPSVNIRIMSFKITVMGEVGAPGVYNVPDGRINLLEALAMAGDLTIFGRRDNLLLIRNEGGEKEYKRLSLSDSAVLQSEHFYLRNNDVLYVEPSKGRSAADDNLYRILPLTVSVLTFVVLIFSISQ
jgi:polysaccharide export outer membrane protein